MSTLRRRRKPFRAATKLRSHLYEYTSQTPRTDFQAFYCIDSRRSGITSTPFEVAPLQLHPRFIYIERGDLKFFEPHLRSITPYAMQLKQTRSISPNTCHVPHILVYAGPPDRLGLAFGVCAGCTGAAGIGTSSKSSCEIALIV